MTTILKNAIEGKKKNAQDDCPRPSLGNRKVAKYSNVDVEGQKWKLLLENRYLRRADDAATAHPTAAKERDLLFV